VGGERDESEIVLKSLFRSLQNYVSCRNFFCLFSLLFALCILGPSLSLSYRIPSHGYDYIICMRNVDFEPL
jgi:membrane protein required for beta-lactamase induction